MIVEHRSAPTTEEELPTTIDPLRPVVPNPNPQSVLPCPPGYRQAWEDGAADYQAGEYHGLVARFYPDGVRRHEVWYRQGVVHGTSSTWNPQGRLETMTRYEDDTYSDSRAE